MDLFLYVKFSYLNYNVRRVVEYNNMFYIFIIIKNLKGYNKIMLNAYYMIDVGD